MKTLTKIVLAFTLTMILVGCGAMYSYKQATIKGVIDKTILVGAVVSGSKEIKDTNVLEWKNK